MKMYLSRTLQSLAETPLDELVSHRYEKFREMGVYLDAAMSQGAGAESAT